MKIPIPLSKKSSTLNKTIKDIGEDIASISDSVDDIAKVVQSATSSKRFKDYYSNKFGGDKKPFSENFDNKVIQEFFKQPKSRLVLNSEKFLDGLRSIFKETFSNKELGNLPKEILDYIQFGKSIKALDLLEKNFRKPPPIKDFLKTLLKSNEFIKLFDSIFLKLGKSLKLSSFSNVMFKLVPSIVLFSTAVAHFIIAVATIKILFDVVEVFAEAVKQFATAVWNFGSYYLKEIFTVLFAFSFLGPQLGESMARAVMSTMFTLADMFVSNLEGIADAAMRIIDTIVDFLNVFIPNLINSAANILVVLFSDFLPKLIEKLAVGIINVINSILDNLPRVISSLEVLLISLVEGLSKIASYLFSREFLNALKKVWNSLVQSFNNVITFLFSKFSGMDLNIFKVFNLDMVSKLLGDLFNKIGVKLDSIISWALDLLKSIVNSLSEFSAIVFKVLVISGIKALEFLLTKLPKYLIAVLIYLVSMFRDFFSTVIESSIFSLKSALPELGASISKVIKEFIFYLIAIFPTALQKLSTFLLDLVLGFGKVIVYIWIGLLKTGIAFFSEFFKDLPKRFFTYILIAFTDFFKVLDNLVNYLVIKLFDYFNSIGKDIGFILQSILESLWNVFTGFLRMLLPITAMVLAALTRLLWQAATFLYNSLIKVGKFFFSYLYDIIKKVFVSIWNFIKSFFSKNTWKSLFSGIVGVIKNIVNEISMYFYGMLGPLATQFTKIVDYIEAIVNKMIVAILAWIADLPGIGKALFKEEEKQKLMAEKDISLEGRIYHKMLTRLKGAYDIEVKDLENYKDIKREHLDALTSALEKLSSTSIEASSSAVLREKALSLLSEKEKTVDVKNIISKMAENFNPPQQGATYKVLLTMAGAIYRQVEIAEDTKKSSQETAENTAKISEQLSENAKKFLEAGYLGGFGGEYVESSRTYIEERKEGLRLRLRFDEV